jgi:hypothetical protein
MDRINSDIQALGFHIEKQNKFDDYFYDQMKEGGGAGESGASKSQAAASPATVKRDVYQSPLSKLPSVSSSSTSTPQTSDSSPDKLADQPSPLNSSSSSVPSPVFTHKKTLAPSNQAPQKTSNCKKPMKKGSSVEGKPDKDRSDKSLIKKNISDKISKKPTPPAVVPTKQTKPAVAPISEIRKSKSDITTELSRTKLDDLDDYENQLNALERDLGGEEDPIKYFQSSLLPSRSSNQPKGKKMSSTESDSSFEDVMESGEPDFKADNTLDYLSNDEFSSKRHQDEEFNDLEGDNLGDVAESDDGESNAAEEAAELDVDEFHAEDDSDGIESFHDDDSLRQLSRPSLQSVEPKNDNKEKQSIEDQYNDLLKKYQQNNQKLQQVLSDRSLSDSYRPTTQPAQAKPTVSLKKGGKGSFFRELQHDLEEEVLAHPHHESISKESIEPSFDQRGSSYEASPAKSDHNSTLIQMSEDSIDQLPSRFVANASKTTATAPPQVTVNKSNPASRYYDFKDNEDVSSDDIEEDDLDKQVKPKVPVVPTAVQPKEAEKLQTKPNQRQPESKVSQQLTYPVMVKQPSGYLSRSAAPLEEFEDTQSESDSERSSESNDSDGSAIPPSLARQIPDFSKSKPLPTAAAVTSKKAISEDEDDEDDDAEMDEDVKDLLKSDSDNDYSRFSHSIASYSHRNQLPPTSNKGRLNSSNSVSAGSISSGKLPNPSFISSPSLPVNKKSVASSQPAVLTSSDQDAMKAALKDKKNKQRMRFMASLQDDVLTTGESFTPSNTDNYTSHITPAAGGMNDNNHNRRYSNTSTISFNSG